MTHRPAARASRPAAAPCDAAIAGGGVAGLALALQLGRAGRSVTVVDPAPLPRDKVCGEGIMPAGLAVLRRLGLAPETLGGHPFGGLDYHSFGAAATLRFAPGVQGRGIRRTVLLAALAGALEALPTVRVVRDRVVAPLWAGERVAGLRGRARDYPAAVSAAADGVHSALARRVAGPLAPRGYRMGLRQHFRLPGPVPLARVAVGLFTPHHVYLTPVGPAELLATTMTDRAGFRAIAGDYAGFLRGTPFGHLFRGAEPASRRLGWYHPLFEPARYDAGGLLLVGDAGGGTDPCLGLGIALALLTTEQAFASMAGMLEEPRRRDRWARAFDRDRRKLFRHYRGFDTLFHSLVARRWGSEALVRAMGLWPETGEEFLRIVAERRPWRGFSWRSLLAPAARFGRPGGSVGA